MGPEEIFVWQAVLNFLQYPCEKKHMSTGSKYFSIPSLSDTAKYLLHFNKPHSFGGLNGNYVIIHCRDFLRYGLKQMKDRDRCQAQVIIPRLMLITNLYKDRPYLYTSQHFTLFNTNQYSLVIPPRYRLK